MQLYSSVPFGQVARNGFWALNNTFGKGELINGIDYTQTITARPAIFPNDTIIEWSWPDVTSGSPFAYSYPLIAFGRTEFGNPYKVVGPWPQKIDDISKLVAHYDISLGGNLNSYDVLLDIFLTAEAQTDRTYVAEVSFFPYANGIPMLGEIHTFSFGDAYVGSQGTQILIQPCTGKDHRDILVGSIDLKEIFVYLKSIGLLSGNEWMQGIQFGVEVQVPAPFNSPPHMGHMHVHQLSYDWY